MSTLSNTGKIRAGRVKHDVSPYGSYPANRQRLFLKKGDLVWIREDGGITSPTNPQVVWVNVQNINQSGDIKPLTAGIVLLANLEVGQYSQEYSTVISYSFNQNVSRNSQADTPLQRTLEALFRAMSIDSDRLLEAGFNLKLLDRLKREGDDIAKRIVNYMPRPVFHALKEGLVAIPGNTQDTFEQLWATPQDLHISTTTSGSGVYAHEYRKANLTGPGGCIVRNAWYFGKTINFGKRYTQHSSVITSHNEPTTSRNHYKMARHSHASGHGWRAIKLVDVPETVKDQADILAISEQALVCIMHSTNEKLLKIATSEAIERLGRDFVTAAVMHDICQKVFADVGWATTMPSVTGANWSMPMAESGGHEQALWNRVLIPPTPEIDENTQVAIFRRQVSRFSTKVLKRESSLTVHDVESQSGTSKTWRTWIAPKDIPVEKFKNREFQLVLEIQLGKNDLSDDERKARGLAATDHPTPWAKYPAIHALTQGQWINRLCARFEYTDVTDNKVKSWLLQPRDIARLEKTREDGPPMTHMAAKVWVYPERMLRIQFEPVKPAWMAHTAPARIQHITFDHLKQQFMLHSPGPYPFKVKPPSGRTLLENAMLMAGNSQRGILARYPGIRLGQRPEKFGGPGPTRVTCDFCKFSVSGVKCVDQQTEESGLVTCKNCRCYMRPCSWTETRDFQRNGWVDLAILPDITGTAKFVRDATSDLDNIDIDEIDEVDDNDE